MRFSVGGSAEPAAIPAAEPQSVTPDLGNAAAVETVARPTNGSGTVSPVADDQPCVITTFPKWRPPSKWR
jgi:hypothetical protein